MTGTPSPFAFCYKTSAMGPTEAAGEELATQFLHLLFEFQQSATGGKESIIAGQVTPTQHAVAFAGGVHVLLDERVTMQGPANVLYKTAPVRLIRVRQKGDALDFQRVRCDVEPLAVRLFPDSVVFCLDEDAGPFPYGPAINGFSALLPHPLWNDDMALIRWLAGQGLAADGEGSMLADLPAEFQRMPGIGR